MKLCFPSVFYPIAAQSEKWSGIKEEHGYYGTRDTAGEYINPNENAREKLDPAVNVLLKYRYDVS